MCDLFIWADCFEEPNSSLDISSQTWKVSDRLNFTNFLDLLMPQVKYVLLMSLVAIYFSQGLTFAKNVRLGFFMKDKYTFSFTCYFILTEIQDVEFKCQHYMLTKGKCYLSMVFFFIFWHRSCYQFHLVNIIWMLRRALKIRVLLLLLTYLQQYLWKRTMQILNIRTFYEVLQIILLQCFEWDGRRLNVLMHWITSDFHRKYQEGSPFSHCICILLEMTFTELKQIFLQGKHMSGVSIFPYLE